MTIVGSRIASERRLPVFVRILGAHQSESRETAFTSILIDDVLAIDAGSLASRLSLDEQYHVRNLLLTHRHWDHLKDVAAFGFNLFSRRLANLSPRQVNLYGLADVRETLDRRLLATDYWLDFFSPIDLADPVFEYHNVGELSAIEVAQYQVRAIPSNHGVPTIGFEVANAAGRKVYYTSDNGPGSARNWNLADPGLLITECTYSNTFRELDGGRMHGHLCPSQLRIELETFAEARGYLPRVVILHINPFCEKDIRQELADVARDLSALIEVAAEGSTYQL
jgi:ribonuclease BN (tRNA processing enzyme)